MNQPSWCDLEKNLGAVTALTLTALAAGKDATVSQLALAWLLSRSPDIVPIPGTRSVPRVATSSPSTRCRPG